MVVFREEASVFFTEACTFAGCLIALFVGFDGTAAVAVLVEAVWGAPF